MMVNKNLHLNFLFPLFLQDVVEAARTLSKAKRTLASSLANFQFDCLGTSLTDDEIIIANSLKEFGKLIAAIEDEKDRLLDRAFDQFIVPLENFRKEHIGAVKERKKKFEKQTAKFCASQERYLGLSTKKQDTVLQEVCNKLSLLSSSLSKLFLVPLLAYKVIVTKYQSFPLLVTSNNIKKRAIWFSSHEEFFKDFLISLKITL